MAALVFKQRETFLRIEGEEAYPPVPRVIECSDRTAKIGRRSESSRGRIHKTDRQAVFGRLRKDEGRERLCVLAAFERGYVARGVGSLREDLLMRLQLACGIGGSAGLLEQSTQLIMRRWVIRHSADHFFKVANRVARLAKLGLGKSHLKIERRDRAVNFPRLLKGLHRWLGLILPQVRATE